MDLTHITQSIITVLISAGLWMLRSIMSDQKAQCKALDELDTKVTTISTVLMGPLGDNGLRSDVRDNTKSIAGLTLRVAVVEAVKKS